MEGKRLSTLTNWLPAIKLSYFKVLPIQRRLNINKRSSSCSKKKTQNLASSGLFYYGQLWSETHEFVVLFSLLYKCINSWPTHHQNTSRVCWPWNFQLTCALSEFLKNANPILRTQRAVRLVMWFVAEFAEVTIRNPSGSVAKTQRDTNYLDNHRVQTYWQTTRTVYFRTGPN